MNMNKNLKKNSGDEFWESRYGQHLIEEVLLKEVEDRRTWELFEQYLEEQEILEKEAEEKKKEMEEEEEEKRRKKLKERRRDFKKNLDDGKNKKITFFLKKKKKVPATIPYNFKNK